VAPDTGAAEDFAAIATHELTRQFDGVAAVDRVTMTIRQGEMFGLIGPNGAGKSTLIKMLTTLLPPTSGSAAVVGYDIVRQAGEVRRHIGYVPQLLSADGALTGYENMLLSARLYGIPRAERTARITRALARMGLTQVAHHLVGHYSGGMIRRIKIAQNLLHRPRVLFLEEPTIGLYPAARETVWDHVRDLWDSFHTTIVVSSHHMEEIEAMCDRVAVIDRGRVVIIGAPAELRSRARPGATLDDLFIQLVGAAETEGEEGYGAVRRARRAAREHG
jgi:ABC-2 type transport system ATP-binding protein